MKGQLSAEMLILLVVIVSIVALVATQLIGSAKETSSAISEKTEILLEKTDMAKSDLGQFCVEDSDCATGRCISNRCS